MLYNIVVAIIGSYIFGWIILSIIHAWDRRQAQKHRAEFEKVLAAKGQTLADWQQTMESLRAEHFFEK